MDKILSIINMIESILPGTISIDEIAQRSGYSRWYLQRQFKHATGLSIGQYQRNRLLSLAAQQIGTTDNRILDIAIDFGFESQEAFARAFKRFTTVAPKNIRQHAVWAERLSFPAIDGNLLAKITYLRDTPLTVNNQPAMRMACYAIRQNCLSRDGASIEQAINASFEHFYHQPFASQFTGISPVIIELAEHNQYASSFFPLAIAFPLNANQPIPEAMFEIQLPARTMAHVALPDSSYIPAVFYHLAIRMSAEHGLRLSEPPHIWYYNADRTCFNVLFAVEGAIPDSDPHPISLSSPDIIHLPHTSTRVSTHQLLPSQQAGTRRLSTLLTRFSEQVQIIADTEQAVIAFGDTTIGDDAQYQISFSSATGPESLHYGGTYLRTLWKGSDIFRIENHMERMYFELMQHPELYYTQGYEIIRHILWERSEISFELLTPIKNRRGDRPASR
ncbi:helix-turn-helix domain-containing protein [Photobacterium nomapromontoriensis]|uniref:helix-turn-helix domain-containing protein n=1 Tax=Photobacterium nomapromontoriensis TaxID=2910237 RepID=UPI003D10CAA6